MNKDKLPQILLFSGGIDSYIAWHYCGKPQTLYFITNTKYCQEEKRVVKELIPGTIFDESLNFIGREEGEKAYVPYRNLLFAAMATKYSDNIIMAGVKDDAVNDKNRDAFEDFSATLSEYNNEGRDITVESPFWNMTKEEVIAWYLTGSTEAKKEKIYNLMSTISCYNPPKGGNYCGVCPSCYRKTVALHANGIKHLTFLNKKMMVTYYRKALNGQYDEARCNSIIKYTQQRFGGTVDHMTPHDYFFDIDGTLTVEDEGHSLEDYRNRTPRPDIIKYCNTLYDEGHRITLYSSRHFEDEQVTIDWLEDNGVKYNSLLLGKPHYHAFIDDRSVNPNTLTSVEEIRYENRIK